MFLLLVCVLPGCTNESADEATTPLAKFAQCLKERGATMYGAEWCSHCKKQKALFGEDFKHINYKDCESEGEACDQVGIEGYPTWVFGDGAQLMGMQQLETLAKKTGCEYTP